MCNANILYTIFTHLSSVFQKFCNKRDGEFCCICLTHYVKYDIIVLSTFVEILFSNWKGAFFMTNAVARILITGILVTHLLNPFFLYHLLKGIILSFRKWLRRILLKETSFVEYKEYFFCGIAPVSRFLLVQSLFFAFGCGFALFCGMYATSLVQERPFLPVIFYLVNVIMSESFISSKDLLRYKWISVLYSLCVIYPLSIIG